MDDWNSLFVMSTVMLKFLPVEASDQSRWRAVPAGGGEARPAAAPGGEGKHSCLDHMLSSASLLVLSRAASHTLPSVSAADTPFPLPRPAPSPASLSPSASPGGSQPFPSSLPSTLLLFFLCLYRHHRTRDTSRCV
ncbi:hypothetical protein E2C01_045177 [Portunus trituberculatus]|uniref:Uncharacterized protein n=1 Tax=Portunus trituberculatus TaxID=210409 RepID=A0A5B7G242_PORTR|nr:hypothetical protein [Portunus trituberculatus]